MCPARGADAGAEAYAGHLREATRDGRACALIPVFAPDAPGRPGPRRWNEQLVRHAGDARNADITGPVFRLGGPGTSFDVLPQIAGRLGFDIRTDETLWKDRALTPAGGRRPVVDRATPSREPAARQTPRLRPGQIPRVWSRPLVIDC
ncbi:nitric oxide synthase oxygenase [Streptomyces sp. NPDC001604]|uniref:nitric oxide synthase oxygenase n=1 Tax=Streptomyces sp. NPDC001604 TaxID=3364593 RepID=UPI00368982D3